MLSLTASVCKGGKKNTKGEIYLYAKCVYLKRLPSISLKRKQHTRDKGHGGARAALTDDMEHVPKQEKSKDSRINR